MFHMLYQFSAIQYLMRTGSCDEVCQRRSKYCMATDHGFPRDTADKIFNDFDGVASGKTDEIFKAENGSPRYDPVAEERKGFEKIGFAIDCFVTPPQPEEQRLCPCKMDPGKNSLNQKDFLIYVSS